MKKKILAISCALTLQAPIMFQTASAAEPAQTLPQQAPVPALAANTVNSNVSKEKALSIAKQFVAIPSGYKQESVHYSTNWYPGNRSVWNIYWSKQDNQRYYGSISITIDADTGEVISMNQWEENENPVYPPEYDYEKAKAVAEQFVRQKVADKADNVQLRTNDANRPPLQGNAYYTYQFNRVENGIEVMNQYIVVTVNGSGKVTGYELRWDNNLEIPSAADKLTADEAQKIMYEAFPLHLNYQSLDGIYVPTTKSSSYKLTYDNLTNIIYLDAQTGKWLDHAGNEVKTDDFDLDLKPLADKQGKAPYSGNKDLSQEEALKLVKKYITVPNDFKLDHVSFNDASEYQPYPSWSFQWIKGAYEYSIHATVNAKNGEIISYSYDDPSRYRPLADNEEVKQKVNYEDAKKIAEKALQTFLPHKLHKLTFAKGANIKPENEGKQREFYYTFHRLENGVRADQSVSITVSAETGEVIGLYQYWNDNMTYPNPEQAISLEKAKEIYFKRNEIKEKYVYIEPPYGEKNAKAKIKHIYHAEAKPANEAVYLDAIKGEWVSVTTGEALRNNGEPKDIAGHRAEKELKLLIDYQAIEVNDDGFVLPDQAITRGEMVKMLLLVTNPDPYYYRMSVAYSTKEATFADVAQSSPYYPYVESAAQLGLLDTSSKQFKPEEEVTRDEFAAFIVKALRLESLSSFELLFNIEFADKQSIEHKAAAAIVHHLGILQAENGNFGPAKHVSRADAAVSFYQFLQVRQKLNNNRNFLF